jgi:hypothetical protein
MDMQISSARFAVVVLLAFSALLPVAAFAGPEEAAIIAGTKKYLAANSYSSDMRIKVEKVSGDYARVAVEPKKKDMDGATVFLKRARHLGRPFHRHRLGPGRSRQASYPEVAPALTWLLRGFRNR